MDQDQSQDAGGLNPAEPVGLDSAEPGGLDFSEDARLIAAVGDGSLGAAEQLVERHQERIYRLAYRLTGDPDVAADIAQETFLRALQSLDRIADGRAFTQWLSRTATNLARDRWRSRRDWVALEDEQADWQVGRPTPQRDAESAQTGERIQAALMELPHRYREAFVLRHVEQMSHDEMCDELGISLSAVKVRIHRACGMMRDLLPEYDEGSEES
ncbi:MAG: RNA polymerase sigma factor [Gemmatimonadetes bacterium]|nr:RNA polymerase sigma factor [Gemmatimonadota bacterium]MBT6146283.1 RNA polymerase sigma factor [Gemmatimonadota bacterium]MBT7862498.1 RNA polymerase sigma factor [Gemmatimonadota bacterium]